MTARGFIIVLLLPGMLGLLGCSSSGDTPNASKIEDSLDNFSSQRRDDIRTFLSSKGLTVLDQVEVDGDVGYLAEFKELNDPPGIPKYCFVLTGTPHSMGYQAASLRPEAALGMLTRFMKVIGLSQLNMLGLGIDPDSPEGDVAYGILYEAVRDLARDAEAFIPDRLKEEMTGIADAMRDAGHTEITYDDVLLLNQGIDSTFYLLAAMMGGTPNQEANRMARRTILRLLMALPALKEKVAVKGEKIFFKNLPQDEPPGTGTFRFGCNELVLGGDLTANGETYHGRDFMFSTAGVYQEAAGVMVYLPDEGIPFVAIDPPGFVGHSVGLNAHGVSIGVDVNQGVAFGRHVGVGCLLINRHVLDTATGISEAIEAVKATEKGVQWIYVVADDEEDPLYGSGVELETGKSDDFSGPDLLPRWEQWMLRGFPVNLPNWSFRLGVDYVGMLTDAPPDRGVMVRGANWVFPEAFSDVNISLPVPDPWFQAHGRTSVGIYFPEQVEDHPDVLVATNHCILPRMRFTQLHPIVALIYRTGPLPDSVWRYETLLGYVLENIENGVKTEFFGPDAEHPAEGSAGWMIDFLNSNREHDWYYGGNHVRVEGHHTIMNNTTREIRALFGHMGDPWVGLRLPDFVDWYYGQP